MNTIVKTLVENWQTKLTCLLLASVLWYIIRQNVKQPQGRVEWPDSAASVEATR